MIWGDYMVVDKVYSNTGKGFEPGVLYCFNYSLKGTLCNQCKSKAYCKREEKILNNAAKELYKLSSSEIKIQMNEIKDYSVEDIRRVISRD